MCKLSLRKEIRRNNFLRRWDIIIRRSYRILRLGNRIKTNESHPLSTYKHYNKW
jgi:hypothetical protein